MRIGINGILLGSAASGATRRIENMSLALANLGHEVFLYVSNQCGSAIPRRGGACAAPTTPLHLVPLAIPQRPAIARAAAERLLLPKRFQENRLDCVECSHFPVPPTGNIPLLVTIHDLRHLTIFHHSPFSRRLLGKRIYASAFERVKKIIAVSKFTQSEILRHFPNIGEKIVVIPNAADHLPIPDPATKRESRILYVGHLEPRKNLAVLLEAFALLKKKQFPHRLQLAGAPKANYEKKLREQAKQLGIQNFIDWLGPVPDSQLPQLYASAALFVFPSIYEGFGIPLLEAMRVGTPVLAARSSSLPEIGAEACLYADPNSSSDWAKQMETILSNQSLWGKPSQAGLIREKTFRWSNSAQLFSKTIQELS